MITRIASLAALLALTSPAYAAMQTTGLAGAKNGRLAAGQMLYERPQASYSGQHFQNALGCVYSRTQAPGYPMVWHLQVNSRVPGCPNTIPGN